MKIARRIVIALIVIGIPAYGWWFADSNAVVVTLDLVFGKVTEVSLWVVVWAAFGTGVLATGLVSVWAFARLGIAHVQNRRATAKLQAELQRLQAGVG